MGRRRLEGAVVSSRPHFRAHTRDMPSKPVPPDPARDRLPPGLERRRLLRAGRVNLCIADFTEDEQVERKWLALRS